MQITLTTTAQSVDGTPPSAATSAGSARSYAMLTTDPTTVVSILAAPTPATGATGPTGAAGGVLITQLTAQSPKAQVADSSTYVYYVLTQGSAPTVVWMDFG